MRQFNHTLDSSRTVPSSSIDGLGRSGVAKAIADELMGSGNTHPIVSVYGSWGSGKTFVLDKVVDTIFSGRDTWDYEPIVCVFEAWRFEQEGDLAIALTHTLSNIDKQFTGYRQNPTFSRPGVAWRDKATELMKLLVRSGSSLASAIDPGVSAGLWAVRAGLTASGVAVDTASDTEVAVEPVIDQVQGAMRDLVREIHDTVESEKEPRIVMAIDDLDRCSPERLVSVLEWLKLHLSVPGISYVVALDHIAAARAIVGQYKTYLGDEKDLSYGYRYLEKIVDVEFELGATIGVEAMATSRVFGDGVASVSAAVHRRLARDAASITEASALLGLPGLRPPRTALKIVDRFERCLALYSSPQGQITANSLPAPWAAWLFILCAMFYRISPEQMTEFVRGEGPLVQAWDTDVPPAGLSDACREFASFAAMWKTRSGAEATRLPPEQMKVLADSVRQLVLPT